MIRNITALGRFGGPVRPFADANGQVDLRDPAAAAVWEVATANLERWQSGESKRKDPAEVRTSRLVVALTAAEKEALDALARAEGYSTTARWARETRLLPEG